jgi:hypothetical protein
MFKRYILAAILYTYDTAGWRRAGQLRFGFVAVLVGQIVYYIIKSRFFNSLIGS